MYIQHKEYLAILDEIDYLKRDNTLLRDQNAILAEELIKQRQKRLKLEQYHVKNMRLIEELNAQMILHQKDNKSEIIEKMTEINKQNKEFLEGKFTNLQKSALTKVETVELQNAKTKVGFYQLTEFANKIRSMYKETFGVENFKGKKQPTLLELVKWIKCLPGVCINLSKTGFSATMSSMSLSNIKKLNSSKLKYKDNHSTLNSTQTKSRVKL